MWKLTADDGRIAWYCGDDPDRAAEMAAELFPGVGVTVTVAEDPGA